MELKLKASYPKRSLKSVKRKIVRTITIDPETKKNLNDELKKAGYKKGIEDINFSNLIDSLLKQYTNQLNKENMEDDS